jgi:uncharacterized protein with von Willebrand factor type A (vWA) domain
MDPSAESLADRRDAVARELSRLVRGLRREGVAVPADAVLIAGQALATVGLNDEARVRMALRAVLLSEVGDTERFDPIFDRFWERLQAVFRGETPGDEGGEAADRPDDVFAPLGGDAGGHTADEVADRVEMEPNQIRGERRRRVSQNREAEASTEGVASPAGASRIGRPEPVGDEVSPAGGVEGPVRRLGEILEGLPDRRWGSGGGQPDVRRALREGLSSGGIPAPLPTRDRAHDAASATLLVDVSRSVLDTVDRGLLIAVLQSIVQEWRGARVFLFDTDLREVTHTLERRTAGGALRALEEAETEWGGGTRIGDSFDVIRRRFPDAIDRRTVVFVLSDGLETGSTERLADTTAWMARRSGALIWLNPLAADPAFEPTVRGLQTVEPYLDGLFAFAGPEDIAEVARQLEDRGLGGLLGYRYDARGTDE